MAYLDYNDFCNYEQDFCRFIMVRIDTIINHLAVQWVLRDICRIRDKNLDRWKNFGSMQNWLLLMDIKLHVTIIPLHLSAILTATRYCYIRETIVPINGYSWKTHFWVRHLMEHTKDFMFKFIKELDTKQFCNFKLKSNKSLVMTPLMYVSRWWSMVFHVSKRLCDRNCNFTKDVQLVLYC